MTNPIEIRYINPIAITLVDNIIIDFELEVKKLLILASPKGCNIAETNFNINEQITISKIGLSMVDIINNTPTKPIEFLINTVLLKIRSIPSLKYPPITGT